MTDGKGGEWIINYRTEDDTIVKADFSPLAVARTINLTRSANLAALGFNAKMLGLDRETVIAVAEKRLSRRGNVNPEIGQAISAGFNEFASVSNGFSWQIKTDGTSRSHLILNGNEAIVLGALAAGVKFFCGYPITPASSILETMLSDLPKMGGTAIQMEDEMAALAACLGASYTGAKSMTATSGPGIALMSELINLSTMAELPVTIVDVQRSGPATGQPTKSEQADLLYAVHGSPGDSPRIVLAPATVEEAFHLTVEAVNLAERYQIPVILLSDGSLANRIEAIPEPDWESLHIESRKMFSGSDSPDFRRFRTDDDGVSEFALPGVDDLPYIAGGMEHSETGAPSSSPQGHFEMSARRGRKIDHFQRSIEAQSSFDTFNSGGSIGIIGWGSTQGAIAEAVGRLSRMGIVISSAHLRHLNPLPEKQIMEWMRPLNRVIVAEENRSGQLAGLIKHLANGRVDSLLPEIDFELTPEYIVYSVLNDAEQLQAVIGE